MQLQALLDQQYAARSVAMVGTRQRVLVTGAAVKDRLDVAARTDNNRVVNFRATRATIGKYVDVVITEALSHSLRGMLTV